LYFREFNGAINFKQNDNVYKPTASLKIDLNINKTDLGLLNFDIEGNQSLDKFTINSYLENNNLESFNVNGSLELLTRKL
jgi:hypothetical protein